jgi:DNA topoisomerase-3
VSIVTGTTSQQKIDSLATGVFMSISLIVAEKPSVARDIARVMGIRDKKLGCFAGRIKGQEIQVTWAVGHLVGISEPEVMDPNWKVWNRAHLPMLPSKWSLSVLSAGQAQFQVLIRLMKQRDLKEVICATDAGREGELIFRYIAEACGLAKPVKRLWISSLTDQSILKGMGELQDQNQFDNLYYSARCRSRADWLVGMNFTRYYTLASGKLLSVGRVQTPTLFLIAKRTREIEAFKPESYFEIIGQFSLSSEDGVYKAGLTEITKKPNHFEIALLGENHLSEEISEGVSRRRKFLKFSSLDTCSAIIHDLENSTSIITQIKKNKKSNSPPELFDLSSLQREANKRFHFTAEKTLKLAQALYESRKVLSYPRTDSKFLPPDVALEMIPLLREFGKEFPGIDFNFALPSKRYVDSLKVSDHHAIIPVGEGSNLSGDEKKIFDLVKIRTLQIFLKNREIEECLVTTKSQGSEGEYLFQTSAQRVIELGWAALEFESKRKSSSTKIEAEKVKSQKAKTPQKKSVKSDEESGDTEEMATLPLWLDENLSVLGSFRVEDKVTSAPKAFTDGTLLSAMENCGASVEDKELKNALKVHGLGTAATRAQTIELLLLRKYIVRSGKYLHATSLGFELLAMVHPSLASVELTASFEKGLELVRLGKVSSKEFEEKINAMIHRILPRIADSGPERVKNSSSVNDFAISHDPPTPVRHGSLKLPSRMQGSIFIESIPLKLGDLASDIKVGSKDQRNSGAAFTVQAPVTLNEKLHDKNSIDSSLLGSCQSLPDQIDQVLAQVFNLKGFRPGQKEVSAELVRGRDALVLMPTGGGKSLCFQIPGIIRSGLSVVVSPLLALMDDQVRRLLSLGIPAFALHSGQEREDSIQVWNKIARGDLKFLFVSPERMANSQFRQKLRSFPLSLVAIDEAHCVSHWGHDFRPDYREIANWIKEFRPTPIVALTATATPKVRDDISKVLELRNPIVHLGGFNRENLAIEVRNLPKADRIFEVRNWLANQANLPAIVYATSRKDTEIYSHALGSKFKTAFYHAGMTSLDRGRVQREFQGGRLDVVVATVAFGMGVDKADIRSVIHLALPASVESYYQEIGRAGRDGSPSRCLLLKSREDRETLEWMFRESYPEVKELEKLFKKISNHPNSDFEKSNLLDKLMIHGAFERQANGSLVPNPKSNWKASYQAQFESRFAQIRTIEAFANQTSTCRMQILTSYFGQDAQIKCQKCDICLGKVSSAPSGETDFIAHVVDYLSRFGRTTFGKLKSDLAKGHKIAHTTFESILQSMAEDGLCEINDESFVAGGKKIFYRSIGLGPNAKGKFGESKLDGASAKEVSYEFVHKRSRAFAKKPSKTSLKVKKFVTKRKSKKRAQSTFS